MSYRDKYLPFTSIEGSLLQALIALSGNFPCTPVLAPAGKLGTETLEHGPSLSESEDRLVALFFVRPFPSIYRSGLPIFLFPPSGSVSDMLELYSALDAFFLAPRKEPKKKTKIHF
jgi:hypothetical protein